MFTFDHSGVAQLSSHVEEACGAAGVALAPGALPRVGIQNPLGIAALEGTADLLLAIGNASIPILFILAFASLVRRYRRSSGQKKQQIKWLSVSAGVLAFDLVVAALATAAGCQLVASCDLAIAEQGERFDRALWTPTAAATGGAGNSNALVGTPETVAQALLDYYDLGVDILSARGYDLLDDAIDFGRYVIPIVREEVAKRDRERAERGPHTLERTLSGLAVAG